MKNNQTDVLNDIYNLILNPVTRDFERDQILKAKAKIEAGSNFNSELASLEAKLRSLALRNNLTPDVTDFYLKITSDRETPPFDLSRHYAEDAEKEARAVFAGGCFWCMVEPFESKPGIIAVFSGYTGGHTENPTYDQVSGGYTGHAEAVEIIYNTQVWSYEQLLDLYWQLTDPTDAFGQMADRGSNYRPVIFFLNKEQQKLAEHSKQQLENIDKYKTPIVTAIEPVSTFWLAENFHQQFYLKNPKIYKKVYRARNQLLKYKHTKEKIRHSLLNLQKNKTSIGRKRHF
ncbi:TPA_asm: peptide-methionine (S)-S-oxide reductase [Listeria monocytogenes]|nr:peptide-methionine (S)-S-oxide reductase [Listeria monocytogenes]